MFLIANCLIFITCRRDDYGRINENTNWISKSKGLEAVPHTWKPGQVHFNRSSRTPWALREEVLDELADVLTYCCFMADALDADVEEIILNKLEKTAKKYPVKKAKGVSTKYDKLWFFKHECLFKMGDFFKTRISS